ncbi:glycine cleavage system aminomethyltransferase GcvT [Pelagibacterium halotolerans]|uniref:aminomethyltransferase n=1 Tax=Pelagibacterium halotolerans (strain DSM 22347 / JCM 15775 / CGMCC 1.7692 / B2) TaxID=1082931 RepID=G4RB42_PELHB|nr:glycine cleavage system aminomethyltransferase GcvT [Pelagibacterium halotolerans]AEQ50551.1 aminomethyltransferase (glycine cleavage system T protein) [Pelagibacterium halotolerans B2]QJR19500.1 glycine cleavage system aminomethyltransferase GcvT [Pelagibacterium halotolerans]SDZ89598.1 aminomethyltransferase [Pelagibacterium halotolerans]
MAAGAQTDLLKTALYDRHVDAGGRMVEFGGYALPVQYAGIVAEHNHTREAASLFDVSHMGQVVVTGPDHKTTIAALEALTPADLASLEPGQMRYTVLLNDEGGIEDDLIITRPAKEQEPDGVMYMVVNAARKHHDLQFIRAKATAEVTFDLRDDLALIALQGPRAAEALGKHCEITEKLGFMQAGPTVIGGIAANVSRSGYTGEDGFELSVANKDAPALFDLLVADPLVEPAGLGARDSLRLEAGLCLYGHDMTDTVDPVSASLLFAIGKRRRAEGGFTGADAVLARVASGPDDKRVGIRFEGRQPVREGAELVDAGGTVIGKITSGTFAPTAQASIAMGYVPAEIAKEGEPVTAMVRGKPIAGTIAKMPFVPQRYYRKPA